MVSNFSMAGNIFIYIYIALYVAFLIGVGILAARKTKNMDDYATARKCYPWWVIGLIMPATFASGSTFLGCGGMAYGIGFPAFWYFLGYPLAGYLGMSVLGRFTAALNRIGVRSIPEFLGKRYKSDGLRLIAGCVTFGMLFLIAGQFVASATILETLFGLDYRIGVVISAVLMLAYITIGGAHADFMTNTVQAIIMCIVSLCCLGLFAKFVMGYGGLDAFAERLANINPELSPASIFNSSSGQYSGWFPVTMIFFSHFAYMFLPHFGIKMAGLDKVRDMPKAIILASIVGTGFVVFAPLPGLVGPIELPGLARSDMAVPAMFQAFTPDWLSAFLIIGIFCAIMSTGAGIFVTLSQVTANDFYRLTFAPKWGHDAERVERTVKIITRITIFAVAILGAAIVWTPPKYMTLFLWLGIGIVISGMVGPILIGMFWAKTTRTAAYVCAVLGSALYIIMTVVLAWNGMTAAGISFIIGIVITYVVSKMTSDSMSAEYLRDIGFYSKQGYEAAIKEAK